MLYMTIVILSAANALTYYSVNVLYFSWVSHRTTLIMFSSVACAAWLFGMVIMKRIRNFCCELCRGHYMPCDIFSTKLEECGGMLVSGINYLAHMVAGINIKKLPHS